MSKAHFLKISIKTDEHKFYIPPIPFFMTSTIISTVKLIYKLANKKPKADVDINELLLSCKEIIKELKKYPPFEIVNIESENNKILIKTI